ncbi:MAG: ribose-phosphate pyrophosphokinase [Clostridiales bacterium]|nr:ribose-phosphate pyrophosphokinase [Clostridiales bacterium]
MAAHCARIKVFSGNSNRALAGAIAAHLGTPLGKSAVSRFSDGEISCEIQETVRGLDVFVVQSTSAPVNRHLMELLIMIDAFKRASAGRITAVIPYFGYARQDRKVHPRDPITAKLVADLITAAGAHRVLTMDLHAAQIQGFFNIPVDHVMGAPLLASHYLARRFDGNDLVVVSPDIGSVARARNFANRLNATLAIVDKRRPKANMSEVMNIIGEVSGKRCLLADDMIDTAGTLVGAANALVAAGAREVYACASHGVLSGPAIERIENSPIREVVCTDTIALPEGTSCGKLRTISVSEYFSMAIRCIYEEQPISDLVN